MLPDFRNNSEFKQLLKDKEAQIHLRSQGGIQDSDNFVRVHRSIIAFREERSLNDYCAILISYEDLEKIPDDVGQRLFDTLSSTEAIQHNFLIVDSQFSLINKERTAIKDSNDARKFYAGWSEGHCVFLITPTQGVHYFIKGHDVGQAIFFTPDALKSYNELKDVTHICEVFDEYRRHLEMIDTQRKFFVTKATKKSLYAHLNQSGQTTLSEKEFLEENVQLLRNTPEDNFREDLRHFLKERLKQMILPREYTLDNFRRLDIFIADDFGDLYLIEVKWIGISISANGQGFSKPLPLSEINPDGIVQSVEYIKELAKDKKNIKIGYLAVFDARLEDLPDTGNGFEDSIGYVPVKYPFFISRLLKKRR